MSDVLDTSTTPQARQVKGRVPIFGPRLNGTLFDILVTSASITTGLNMHESGTLSCSTSALINTTGILDSTITFLYGQAPRTELFVGYVVDVTETDSGVGNLTFDMSVLGTTKVMQSATPRFWANKSVPQAVSDLANINSLGFIGHDHPLQWRALAQTSDTDWSAAGRFTDRLGWILTSRYGVVMCYDPIRLFTESGSYATLMPSNDKDFDPTIARRLIQFTPVETSNTLLTNMGVKAAYFNDAGAVQVIQEPGVHPSYTFTTDVMIRNSQEADAYIKAASTSINRWDQDATVQIWGDSDIYPGQSVNISTQNSTFIRNNYNGRWLVTQVDQTMDTTQYMTQLTLTRPTQTSPISTVPYRSFWEQAGKAKPFLTLSSYTWISSWASRTVAAVL